MKGSHWDVNFCAPWFAELEKRTNGRVKIEEHWNSELAGLFEVYDSIAKGVIDMGMILPTMFMDKFPMDGILIYDSVNIRSHRPAQTAYELFMKFPEFQKQYERTPLVALSPTPCNGLATRKGKPVRKMEDCKGLKMPGAGPAPEGRQKVVGIVPVSIAPPDMYMSLKTGTADGLAIMIYSLEDFKWLDVLTHVTKVNMNGGPWSHVMSKKAWKSLPPDIQKVFKDMIPWLAELSDKAYAMKTKDAYERYPKEYGTEIIELSQEELDKWAAADDKMLDSYAAELDKRGLPGTKVKEEFRLLQKKYSAPEYAL
jgi:TRAP-type C4-dicarboxylate transport system substrate-binding protein